MALYHAASITPTKQEAIAGWLPTQQWAPSGDGAPEVLTAYRFDDPQGQVGIEVFLVRHGGALVQVPLTYRAAALPGADLVCTMQHTALGERWVYDGLTDPVFVRMLAAATLTGVGQALGLVVHDGRWLVVPPRIRLTGGSGDTSRVPVDGFASQPDEDGWAVLRSELFELRMARLPVAGPQPPTGLTATWKGQAEPVVLSELRRLAG